jgi:hypothetical protein
MRTRAATVALGFVVCAFVSAVVSAAEPAGQPLIAGVGRGGFAVVADAGLKQVFVGRIASQSILTRAEEITGRAVESSALSLPRRAKSRM